MLKCPECNKLAVEFDSYFHRPRCYSCGWLPDKSRVYIENLLFKPCPECFGYSELRSLGGNYCSRCNSSGKIMTPLGREFVEIIMEEVEEKLD